ncbi:MAG: hypothetical protein H7Y06_00055, partial [Opitutaceae bacterium]|nr:hypothetical protein [Opitutaceae bacterium]
PTTPRPSARVEPCSPAAPRPDPPAKAAPIHPTQIFLSNPQALRVEYRLDDQRLILWWSPLAGCSTDCADRNFSSRDAHLEVFAEITVADCGVSAFRSCDYDPYYCSLHFEKQTLHLALRPDLAAVLLWAEQPQAVEFKTHRYDRRVAAGATELTVEHDEPGRRFEFAAAIGPGGGVFRHGPDRAPDFPRYSRAELAAGQLLVIGVGLAAEDIGPRVVSAAQLQPARHLAETDALLAPHEAAGRTVAPRHAELVALRRKVVRGLHSMIDESAGFRAALKSIYSLIWIRDSGFSFLYQAAAGWPHKLPELSRLLLDNPLAVDEPGLPRGRMFGQLINRRLGKLEEDGIYYVVRTLFTQWTQTGVRPELSAADQALLDEALAWVEAVTWDPQRGLYGEHFADETPTVGHRDHGWDHCIGAPISGGDAVALGGRLVARNYDVYFNILLHDTQVMLAALRADPAHLARAGRVWPELEKLLLTRTDGVPVYGEVLFVRGPHAGDAAERALVPHWGCASSCCVWGLTLQGFTPLADWDAVWAATLDAIIAKPDMHWINGICGAMAAVDPWLYPEAKLIALHNRVADETNRPGKYLPMGGAMPEKFNAPEGNLYHDIRPQGFAKGAWLGAWTALGLRRLHHGLALRPTAAFERIENYVWRGLSLFFHYGPTGRDLALEIDGRVVGGTLQVPEGALAATPGAERHIRLVSARPTPLWLRSSVQLDEVVEPTDSDQARRYGFTAFGLSQITFSSEIPGATLADANGAPIAERRTTHAGLVTNHFSHFGAATLTVPAAS